MKASQYNFFFEEDGNILGYNMNTGAFVSLTKEGYENFLTVTRDKTNAMESNELIRELVKGGFLIGDDLNEVELMKALSNSIRQSTEGLTLTILPTMGCNFDCYYCYENKHDSIMSGEVQEKIVQFVRNQAKGLSRLYVSWFGGEPLVAKGVILSLSRSFMDLCSEFGCSYSSDIITNGYLLDRTTAEQLVSVCVKNAQITLDGPKEIHDSKRYKKDRSGTFDTIINNILAVNEIIKITVRVNVDKTNSDSIIQLIDYLARLGLQKKILLNFAQVHADGSVMQIDRIIHEKDRIDEFRKSSTQSLLTTRSFASLEVDLYKYAMEKGFSFIKAPVQKCNACSADMSNSFVVEYNGNLQKCWQTVGIDSEKIGTVFEGVKFGNNLLKWLNYDPFSNSMCRNCRVLPVCMGWCPVKWLNKEVYKLDSTYDPCNAVKYNLKNMLKLYYRSLKEGKTDQRALCSIG